MSSVYIEFQFSDGSSEIEEFEADLGLISDIEEERDKLVDERNSDREEGDEEIECTGYAVNEVDTDYTDQVGPEEFADLDEWAEYCQECEKHGEGYVLRYADVGENSFDDEYNGCWHSFEEFAENYFDDCFDCPDSVRQYIDYEKFADDLRMDYSTYEGREGCHVFRS